MSPGTELEAIEAELKALEAQKAAERKAAASGGEAGPGVGDAPGTPDELEFEDDDGTVYVWDHKWVGEGSRGGAGGWGSDGVGGHVEGDVLGAVTGLRYGKRRTVDDGMCAVSIDFGDCVGRGTVWGEG